jgi:hypothetical protein
MNQRFTLSACALLITGLLTAGAGFAATAATPGATRASWPSLQSQLARDRVPAGSPLAKLIASNQDFQLLRPEEARDKIAVPLWLRVLWRKDHPGLQTAPGDPTGGYPLVLKEVHEWMVSHPDLRPGSPEADVPPAKRAPKPGFSVGPDGRISGAQSSPRSESDIRVNYWDPSQIISSSNNIHGGGTLAMYYSHDGGATWGQTVLPRDISESFQSDPAVDWTSDGTIWATTISVAASSSPVQLFLRSYQSTDGGATWKRDSTLSAPGQNQADKQMMWVDHSERSLYKDTIHVIWHDGAAVFVTHRPPGGSWSDPLQISGGETLGTGIGSDIKTDSQGRVYAFWPDTGNNLSVSNRRIYFARSTDGGQSFSRPVAVGPTFQAFQSVIPAQSNRAALVYVTGGVYTSGSNTNVYAAWTDLSGAVKCRTPFDDPQDNVNSACKTRIWFSRSTNGGTKWTKPRMINNPAGKNDQFNPWMVVDEATGALGIIYYDTVGESRTSVNVFFQSSTNGGASFSTPLRVSTAPSNDQDFNDANQFGDYNALSGIAGKFFPSWTDRRDQGTKEEIWTAPISVRANASCRTVNLFAGGAGLGVANVSVPPGASQTQLAVSHRRSFVSGLNAGSLQVAIDGGSPVTVPASAILSGASLAKGRDLSPVNTVIDLDAVCRAAVGTDCGGRSLRLSFSAGAEASAAGDVWFLDDAAVTSCAP